MGELANREPVSHRKREIAREAGLVGVKNRAFDDFPAKRIGPVQHIEGDVVLRGFLHAVRHRRSVGVKANAGILHIEDERVDTLQHRVGRPARLRIETVNWQAGRRILGGSDTLVVIPGKTVLGTEQCDQLNSRRVREQIDGAAPQRIQARVVGDQANVLPAQWSEFLGFENVEADLHASGATRVFRGASGRVKCAARGEGNRHRSGARQHLHSSRHWDHPSPLKQQ